jgi:hypothetical protein
MLFNFKSVSIFSLFLLMFASCGSTDVNDDIEDAFDAIEENQKKAKIYQLKRDSLESLPEKETGTYSFDRKMQDAFPEDSLNDGVETFIMNVQK